MSLLEILQERIESRARRNSDAGPLIDSKGLNVTLCLAYFLPERGKSLR